MLGADPIKKRVTRKRNGARSIPTSAPLGWPAIKSGIVVMIAPEVTEVGPIVCDMSLVAYQSGR